MKGILKGEKKEKYTVDYCGMKACYTRARDSYKSGEKVLLFYQYVATDTNYGFYLDGERLCCDYHEKRGFIIRFIMPEHNVKLECIAKNVMADESISEICIPDAEIWDLYSENRDS